METLLQQHKEKYTSNQEEGFLLRLESPIPTPSPTDQESPIMFSDSCSMCGSKKRRCLTPSFGKRKKTILIDPSSMKAAASSADDERSHSRHSSFFHQIPNSSPPPPQTSPPPCFRRSVSDVSSFALSGSFSNPKSASAAASAIPSNQTSCPSNAYFGRSNSFSSGFDSLKKSTISPPPPTTTTTTLPEISPFSSPKSPENAASTPNQKSNPSNASYFGRSNSFSSCFDSPLSSRSPSFHLPKSSTTATPTDSVQKSDDDHQKPIGDQKVPSEDCSIGNCKFGVSAATTTDHPKHEQIEEGNIKKVQFSCSCGKHYQVQFFG